MTPSKLDIASASRNFDTFSPSVLQEVVLTASDLCLFVSEARVVEDITRGGALDEHIGDTWIAKPLHEITKQDSWRKLDLLWASQKEDAPVWRHLNFVASDKLNESVPLLVCRVDAGNDRSILVCRDLRPSMKMQKNFNRALAEMEQSFEKLRSAKGLGANGLEGNKTNASTLHGHVSGAVEKVIGEIGTLPLAEIISQTTQVLEDACIQLAYEKCGYNLSKTAEFLGVSSDELAKRIPFAP